MTNELFIDLKNWWYKMQDAVLDVKGDEYATEDRLHNFKAISALTGNKVTPLQVCMILRAKQVISLYDKVFSDKPISTQFFDEKAGDDANYLILAKALHAETASMEME